MFSVMPYTYGYLGIIYFHDARQVSRTGVIDIYTRYISKYTDENWCFSQQKIHVGEHEKHEKYLDSEFFAWMPYT